jgi:hypothetical protein
MKTKALIALLVALVFTVGLVGLSFAAEVKGTVTKIDGKKLTIKGADGKETTVEVKEVPKDMKVGDSVTIKDGMVTVEKKKKKAIEGC